MTTSPYAPLEDTAPLDDITPPAAALAEPLADAPAAATYPTPRVRWAGIVWGAGFALLAATALWWLADASRRAAIHDWVVTLTPGTLSPGVVVGWVVVGVGVLLLAAGGAALLRRARLRAATER